MTIRSVINAWVGTGGLRYLPPALTSAPSARNIFVGEEVQALPDGPYPDAKAGVLAGRARAALDAFSEGQIVSVRLPPSKNVRAQIALLEPANDALWEFRVRDANPQLRIFGRFAERDVFIALTHAPRPDLDWEEERRRCLNAWRRFFPSYNPHTGATINDYVSDAVPP